MTIKELEDEIKRVLSGGTPGLKEQMNDLHRHCSDLLYEKDLSVQKDKSAAAVVSLFQIFHSQGWDLEQSVLDSLQQKPVVGKKIALIGTSASPITNGHLTMGLEILALTDVDMLWYYLVGKHPWGKKLMPAVHRLQMAHLATRRYPRMGVSDFEMIHGDRIYKDTMETAELMERHFMPAYPQHQFCWVMGSDVAQTFHEWSGAEWMAENMVIYIIHRLGYEFDKLNSILAEPKHIYLKDDIVTSNISSSLVRKRGRDYNKEKVLSLVPEVVWDYLLEHKLLDPEVMAL
jgi:nicotinate-nucleotide adenylyltransferase